MSSNNSKWLSQLSCEHLTSLKPYESARRLFSASSGQQRTWLNANEAPESSEYTLDSALLNRYPDCQPESVLNDYARYTGLNNQQITITRGADEGIELLIRAFCESNKDAVLICPPTYGMYAISAQTFNVDVEQVVLNQDFSLNIDEIKTYIGKVKLVFLCSPNNPTGTQIPAEQIKQICQMYAEQALVVLDEAYIEFSSELAQQHLLSKYSNLVILRTLSKGFALAGIRCGFVLSSAEIKQILLKVIAPYPIADPVAQIASQALSEEGLNIMSNRVTQLNKALAKLSAELNKIEQIELVGACCGNFVLFRSPKNKELMQYLIEQQFLIRDQSKQVMLDDCLRITIGNEKQNQQLLDLIVAFMSPQKQLQQEAKL